MAKYRIGCGQITWRDVPEIEILRDVARAGYDGVPPKLFTGAIAGDIIERYARYDLCPAPPYFGASFWRREEQASILAKAHDIAQFVRELGCTELYVAANGGFQTPSGMSRAQVAGHVAASDEMSDRQFDQFAQVLNEFGRITLDSGVRSCFHNHVGTVIETAHELERLLSRVDGDYVFLGLDTGHLAWAGEDTVAICRQYADRIKTLHFKDIDEKVRHRGVEACWDYQMFTGHGVFAELGEGDIDFPAIISALHDAGFDGWLIVETDVTQKATALESATISRQYLRSIGL